MSRSVEFGLGSIPAIASAVVGAPWPAIIVVVGMTVVLVAVYKLAQAVFPQDSADRSEVLRAWLDHRKQRWSLKEQRRQHQSQPLIVQVVPVQVILQPEEPRPAEPPKAVHGGTVL
jgi:hypothetical protein